MLVLFMSLTENRPQVSHISQKMQDFVHKTWAAPARPKLAL